MVYSALSLRKVNYATVGARSCRRVEISYKVRNCNHRTFGHISSRGAYYKQYCDPKDSSKLGTYNQG